MTCEKHQHEEPCPHCSEDEKVLDERAVDLIDAFGVFVKRLMRGNHIVDSDREALLDSLRSLIREARRR